MANCLANCESACNTWRVGRTGNWAVWTDNTGGPPACAQFCKNLYLPYTPFQYASNSVWQAYNGVWRNAGSIAADGWGCEGGGQQPAGRAGSIHYVFDPEYIIGFFGYGYGGRRLEGGNASGYDDAYYGYADERPDEAAAEGGRRLQTPAPVGHHKVLDACWSGAIPPTYPEHNNDAVWKHFDSRAETLAVVPMRTCDAAGVWASGTFPDGSARPFGCDQAYDAWPGAAPVAAGLSTDTIYHSGFDGGSSTDPNSYCDDKAKGHHGENWAAYYFGEAVDLALVEVINRAVTGGRLSEHEVWYCTNGATAEADCDWVRCSNYRGATTDSQVIEHACEAPGATAFKIVKPCVNNANAPHDTNILNIQEAKAFRHLRPDELKPHFSLTQHALTNCGGVAPHEALTFADGYTYKTLDTDPNACAIACMGIPGCNGFVFGDKAGDATEGNCYPRKLALPLDLSTCGDDAPYGRFSTYVMDRHGTDEAVCVPDDGALAAVRCCRGDGSSAISVCDADACFPKWGHSHGTASVSGIGCAAHATFAEAEAECAAQPGMRLCTAQELYYPACRSGCGYDSVRVWTSEDCSPPPSPAPLAPLPPAAPPSPHVPQDTGIGDDLAPHGGFEIWYSDVSAFFGTKARTVLTGQRDRISTYAIDRDERGDYATGRYVTLRIYHPHKRLRLETMQVFGSTGAVSGRRLFEAPEADREPPPGFTPTPSPSPSPTPSPTPTPTPSSREEEEEDADPGAWWHHIHLDPAPGELYTRNAPPGARGRSPAGSVAVAIAMASPRDRDGHPSLALGQRATLEAACRFLGAPHGVGCTRGDNTTNLFQRSEGDNVSTTAIPYDDTAWATLLLSAAIEPLVHAATRDLLVCASPELCAANDCARCDASGYFQGRATGNAVLRGVEAGLGVAKGARKSRAVPECVRSAACVAEVAEEVAVAAGAQSALPLTALGASSQLGARGQALITHVTLLTPWVLRDGKY